MSLSNKELLDKIKNQVAHDHGWLNWEAIPASTFKDELWDIVCERFATEKAKELQAFKDYVHKRLDDAGIEKDPESEHKAAGCRIGGRLDIVLSKEFTRSEVESCIKDSLEAAAENAKIKFVNVTRKTDNSRIEEVIDKSSITDTKNIKIK